jgi:hypothetical protein
MLRNLVCGRESNLGSKPKKFDGEDINLPQYGRVAEWYTAVD